MSRKRNRPHALSDSDGSGPDEILNNHFENDEVDISSALTGKKRRLSRPANDWEEDDDPEDFSRFIRESIVKRDTKEGTQMVKKLKGKQKVVKGEVGGGSFQSMGRHFGYDTQEIIVTTKIRPSSIFTQISDFARIPGTNTYTTVDYPIFACQSSARPRWDGSYGVGQVLGLYDTSRSAARW